MPKNQSTAAKKARALQRTAGGKHTALLAGHVCGKSMDPFGEYKDVCARPPHSTQEPCSTTRDFDAQEWNRRAAAEQATAEAQWARLSDDERAEQERLAFEDEYDDGRTAEEASEDARSWKWED